MKSKRYNILITGCGGDIGQSIGKILTSDAMFDSVIGCDINSHHAGKFIFNKCYEVPLCTEVDYLSSLELITNKENIDVILPSSEPELRFFSERKMGTSLFGKTLILPNSYSLIVGFDKYLTFEFLKKNSFPYPKSFIVGDCPAAPFFPSILKSRNGSGSKSVFILRTHDDFDYYRKKYPDFIIQEHVGDVANEYTCGLFRTKAGETRAIIYRRRLLGGYSNYGSVTENETIHKLLFGIAEKLNLVGSINVQLRMSDNCPYVFEINPRFSSTVMFRHMMGFEDVLWTIQDSLGIAVSQYKRKENITNFYKGFIEYVD